MNKTSIVTLIVIAIIAIGGYFFPSVTNVVTERVEQAKGALSSPQILDLLELESGVLYSNSYSTTTGASMTLKLADVKNYDTIVVTPTGAATAKTLTFFASSTASNWLPRIGDTQRTCFVNATTTAGANLTFAAGTGIDLQSSSSTVSILHDNIGCFTFTRKATTTTAYDIMASFTPFQDGD